MKHEFDDGRIVEFELGLFITPEEPATMEHPGCSAKTGWDMISKLDKEDEKEITEWLYKNEWAVWQAIEDQAY